MHNKLHNLLNALPGLEVRKVLRPLAAHAFGVLVHDVQAGADEGGEFCFVGDEEVGAGDAGAALAGDFFAGGYVDIPCGRACSSVIATL